MKKIILIEPSKFFRNYLSEALESVDINIIPSRNADDGIAKIKTEKPDLVIMDYYLPDQNCIAILSEMKKNKATKATPVIIVSSPLLETQKQQLVDLGIENVNYKPVNLDELISQVTRILKVPIIKDKSACMIEAHLNEDILFLEISKGLNADKIKLFRYKTQELLDLYKVESPQIIFLLSDLNFTKNDNDKLDLLFNIILETTKSLPRDMKIITQDNKIKNYITSHRSYTISKISLHDNLTSALKGFKQFSGEDFSPDRIHSVLEPGRPIKTDQESIRLDFNTQELMKKASSHHNHQFRIAIVDDDLVVRKLISNAFSKLNWKVKDYENGRKFIENVKNEKFDLIFLDLVMPELDGFGVLDFIHSNSIETPVIVLSVLNKKMAVLKTIQSGVKGYLIKPIKPKALLLKSIEVLGTSIK